MPCPDCGHVRVKIGEEVSEQLEYVPASLFVKKQTWCLRCQVLLTLTQQAW
ncbi:MAG: IS66 family transposase zinc-finger binding domain-containing protein [Solirubrobacterales bacterium]